MFSKFHLALSLDIASTLRNRLRFLQIIEGDLHFLVHSYFNIFRYNWVWEKYHLL